MALLYCPPAPARADYNKCVAAMYGLEPAPAAQLYLCIHTHTHTWVSYCIVRVHKGRPVQVCNINTNKTHRHTRAYTARAHPFARIASTEKSSERVRVRNTAPCSRAAVYYPFKKTYANDVSLCVAHVSLCVCVCLHEMCRSRRAISLFSTCI